MYIQIQIQIHDQPESIKAQVSRYLDLTSLPHYYASLPLATSLPAAGICRSIHAYLQCNGISHVKLVHSCQSLRRGERLSFQGSHSQRPKDPFFALPTTRPRPRIMNSLHPLIASLICEHAKPSLASSSELGKASDACMPFVPVSMEATTLLLLPNLLSFFLS